MCFDTAKYPQLAIVCFTAVVGALFTSIRSLTRCAILRKFDTNYLRKSFRHSEIGSKKTWPKP